MASDRQPATPRPSASLIIIDQYNRVLMVERNANSKSFAGAYVFPGGNLDVQQDTSPKLTAIRETFEESGILLATSTSLSPPLSQATLATAREAVHAQRIPFTSFLADHGLAPDVDALLPFTQWITPPTIHRRFHTHFFVTFLPTHSSFDSDSSYALQHLPTSDGGIEVISVRFFRPQDAISEFKAEKISLMVPQFYLLTTLAPVLSGDTTTTSAQRDTIRRWAHGSFGGLVFNPRPLPKKDENGHVMIAYEGDEARGGQPGARHRAHVRSRNGAVGSTITKTRVESNGESLLAFVQLQAVRLERNIDIFGDTPRPERQGSFKL